MCLFCFWNWKTVPKLIFLAGKTSCYFYVRNDDAMFRVLEPSKIVFDKQMLHTRTTVLFVFSVI